MNLPIIELNWNDCAGALNIPVYAETLPTTLDCPLCKAAKSLTIFQNTTHNTGWHYCKACNKSGDLFEFCASVLGMSIEATFVELAKRGVMTLINITPKIVKVYEDFYLKTRNKGRIAWRNCETYFKKPTKAVNELLITFNLQLKKWENFDPKIERYVAATHVRDLEKDLGSQYMHRSFVNGKISEELDTLPLRFPSGWSDVLVLPYESNPGDIIGFLCIGYRHGKLQRKFTRVRQTTHTFNGKQKPIDAGLWGLQTSIHGKSTYGNYAVALEDPLLALRIQSRHALMSTTPLPIVSWLLTEGEATQAFSWASVAQKNIVVVTPQLTPSAIHAAYTSGGWLSVLDISNDAMQELVKNKKPEDLMRNFIRRALPWRDAVRRWLNTVSESRARDLFNSLQLHCKEAEVIADEFKDQLQITPARGIKCVRGAIKGKIAFFVENETGWFIRLNVADYLQMTDFTVKLKTIQIRGSSKMATGVLHYKNTDIDVVFNGKELISADAFEDKVVRYCLESGLGYPKINLCSSSVLRLTRLFAEPEIYKYPCVDAHKKSDLVPID